MEFVAIGLVFLLALCTWGLYRLALSLQAGS